MTDIDQYKELITLGLDKQIARLKGGIVLDEFDPAVDNDIILRKRLNRFVKRKNVEGLERMLQYLIKGFEFHYDKDFATILFQLTGRTIVPIPEDSKSFSTRRQVSVGTSGKKEHSLTFVSIELPTGSSTIYCIIGKHPRLSAKWLDNQTVEIQIPSVREEIARIKVVKMYEERIDIIYKEIS